MTDGTRLVANFSCGAASAVATKLVIVQYPEREILIVNAFIAEEHPDNQRFLKDCAAWYARPIVQFMDLKYGASTFEVFRRKRFITGMGGAPCSKALKRDVLDPVRNPTDTVVLGYTAEEQARFDRWLDANNGQAAICPLIERGLTKSDCLGILQSAGIKLPKMYELGYQNNNCIGCVKGGLGYWNKIRRDFPEAFERMSKLQEDIGPGASFLKLRDGKKNRYIPLRELPVDAGKYQDEPSITCGLFCEVAEKEVA